MDGLRRFRFLAGLKKAPCASGQCSQTAYSSIECNLKLLLFYVKLFCLPEYRNPQLADVSACGSSLSLSQAGSKDLLTELTV